MVSGNNSVRHIDEEKDNMFAVMLDCSRNAVVSVDGLKQFIGIISRLGYNALMLYTEDTYEVENEPYFGYLRGAYSQEELRDICAYAKKFGIELIPCIQTLAHLNQIFRWPEYKTVKDVLDIMLIDEDRTYELIDRMLSTLSGCFNSKRINIGMDEAHLLGLGKYLDKHGYKDRVDLFNKHIKKVVRLCEKHGFTQPMMWSDMFMRLAHKGNYYQTEEPIPENMLSCISDNLGMIYWDYVNTDAEKVNKIIEHHKLVGNNIFYAGGAWKWSGFAPNNARSIEVNEKTINCCKQQGIENVIVTMWADDGGECSIFSVIPTLISAAAVYWGKDETWKDEKCREITGVSFRNYLVVDSVDQLSDVHKKSNCSKVLFYNDLFTGIFDPSVREGYGKTFRQRSLQIEKVAKNNRFGYVFETVSKLALVLSHKAELGVVIRKAYRAKDMQKLSVCVREIKTTIRLTKDFYQRFRAQWQKENKPFGFDIQQHRFGGMILRMQECANVLSDFISGKIMVIEELEKTLLDPLGENIATEDLYFNRYCEIISPNVIAISYVPIF